MCSQCQACFSSFCILLPGTQIYACIHLRFLLEGAVGSGSRPNVGCVCASMAPHTFGYPDNATKAASNAILQVVDGGWGRPRSFDPPKSTAEWLHLVFVLVRSLQQLNGLDHFVFSR